MFFWNSFAFSMIQQMLAIWSLFPLPFRNPACTSESSQFTYCWSLSYWQSITLLTKVHIVKAMVFPVDMNLSKLQAIVEDRGAWCAAKGSQRVRHDLVTEQQKQFSLFNVIDQQRQFECRMMSVENSTRPFKEKYYQYCTCVFPEVRGGGSTSQ